MSGHTPGPWWWRDVPTPGSEPGAIACVLECGEDRQDPPMPVLRHAAQWQPSQEDKDLIAAAPELLTKVSALTAERDELRGLLKTLHAMVMGECPSLLEDHFMNEKIEDALSRGER